jgi:DNA polymerase IV
MNTPPAKNERLVLHVDINSYFATMLQQENPHLRGKPVGVLKAEGRSCVIAASKEAKARGVETGCRLVDAYPRCPDLITVPAAFDSYLSTTRQLQTIFQNIAPNYFIYSLDEAFIEIAECIPHLYTTPEQCAQQLQTAIKDTLGEWVTCNVGIARNRLLAKMASETGAKGSISIVATEDEDVLLATTTFKDVCGIGYRLGAKLEAMGVTTPYQIRFYSQADLEPTFGPFWAAELLRIAYGEESHNLALLDRPPQPHMDSVGRSITGFRLHNDENEIRSILLNLMEEVTYKARQMDLAGRYVSIHLYGHEDHWRAHKTLTTHVRHTTEMFDILYHQLYENWHRTFPIIKFAVRLGMLTPLNQTPVPLYHPWHQQAAKYKAMDAVNKRYGLFTLRSASLLNRHIIRPEVTGYLGDRIYLGL